MAALFGRDASSIVDEAELREIQTHIGTATAALSARGGLPFPTFYNADSTLAQLAYLLCRILEPETVVETGVAYGATSAVILAALHKNRRGALHSIDLPPIGDTGSRQHIGILVPARYRQSWYLQLGASKRLLPRLLATSIRSVGLFIHDSANNDPVQRMELATAWRRMSPCSALIVNSIQGKVAFREFVERENVGFWLAIEQREKRGHLTGVIVELSKTGALSARM